MQSKTEIIITTLDRGDWLSALRLPSRFHARSDDPVVFKRGFDAYLHPDSAPRWNVCRPGSVNRVSQSEAFAQAWK
jgi:hypothetical protein